VAVDERCFPLTSFVDEAAAPIATDTMQVEVEDA
jgi:hypothetical protein